MTITELMTKRYNEQVQRAGKPPLFMFLTTPLFGAYKASIRTLTRESAQPPSAEGFLVFKSATVWHVETPNAWIAFNDYRVMVDFAANGQ